MLAALLPLASLPWSDVNLLIVTDVHSWVAGHPHPDHDPVLDADYGHVLSLHEHLAATAAASGRDLFFVQNGDLNDGTGFSRKPPAALLPLLQRMPFDALTTGNHELYENENIDFLAQPGGFIDSWTGSFLTANTLNATTGEHLGASHKLLVGPNSGVRVLTFGFLYDMTNHGDHVTVTPVEEVVAQAWFLAALNATEAYDALVFLTRTPLWGSSPRLAEQRFIWCSRVPSPTSGQTCTMRTRSSTCCMPLHAPSSARRSPYSS